MEKKSWFETWFNSPYYHQLYRHRSEAEAQAFIQRLVAQMDLTPQAPVMDLACGKGRHSWALHQCGLQVTGMDLAPNSIALARQDYPQVRFEVGDMRSFDLDVRFEAVFNLFTSFGYFNGLEDNLKVLQRVHAHLRSGGCLVIDFLNAPLVERTLVAAEVQEHEGVRFDIRREVKAGQILKHIAVSDPDPVLEVTEQVQSIHPHDFRSLLERAGFAVTREYGNYHLAAYTPDSPRFIIIATKLH